MSTVHCLNTHTADMPEVDYLGGGVPVVRCPDCRNEFVVHEDALVPVEPSLAVAEAIADEERRGWDGARERALSADPHWGGVLDGP